MHIEKKILPSHITKRLIIEAGSSFGWGKYAGLNGKTLTIDTWGASAPGDRIFKEYGFSIENVISIYHSI